MPMLNKIICALCVGLCAACGSYKAVRPDAPLPVIAQAQTYSVRYQSAQGRTITAVYINSHSPMMVELREGNTVEKLVQVRLRSQGVEYANPSSRWQIGDSFAVLIRGGKEVVFKEIVE